MSRARDTRRMQFPRAFVLQRNVDTSGISGTGVVAAGVQFGDGVCVLRWLSEHRSTGVYASIADLVAVHGHGGATELIWQGDETACRCGTIRVDLPALVGGNTEGDYLPDC